MRGFKTFALASGLVVAAPIFLAQPADSVVAEQVLPNPYRIVEGRAPSL
jgi:hypothetical protein